MCQKIQIESKDEHVILGSTLGESCPKKLLNDKIAELEKISEFVDKLDAQYVFYLLIIVFTKPKLFLRTIPCFLLNDCLETYDPIFRNSLCKLTNVKKNDSQFLQAVLPAAKGGLVVSSARFVPLPAF